MLYMVSTMHCLYTCKVSIHLICCITDWIMEASIIAIVVGLKAGQVGELLEDCKITLMQL